MKILNQFGPPLMTYEGSCKSTFVENTLEGESHELAYSGYFEASQFPSGRMLIGVMGTQVPDASAVPIRTETGSELEFLGTTTEGWTIKLSGKTFFHKAAWLLSPLGAPPPYQLSLWAEYLEATSGQSILAGYDKARFLISNFIWDRGASRDPDPIELRIRDFRILVTPVNDYHAVARLIANGRGVEPTAWIDIESSRGLRFPLTDYRDLVNDIMYLFRLVTGNEVDWYYGESFDNFDQQPLERVHKYAEPTPFSGVVRFRYFREGPISSTLPTMDIAALAETFFNETVNTLDKETLNQLIDQFTRSTKNSPSLEAAGLLASTLTELIASKYADFSGQSDMTPQNTYDASVLPKLKDAINNTALDEDIQTHIGDILQGGYRHTFRKKLRFLRDDLNLPLNSNQIGQIVDTRNSLVHTGRYASQPGGIESYNEFKFIVWANLVALLRLTGYEGGLPAFRENQAIAV